MISIRTNKAPEEAKPLEWALLVIGEVIYWNCVGSGVIVGTIMDWEVISGNEYGIGSEIVEMHRGIL